MTREQILECIRDAPEDELGDCLLELAVEYWLTVAAISKDELLFLTEELADETEEDNKN